MGTSAVTPNVTMIAPDGSIGDVPSTNVNAAMAAGGKLGIHVYAPDGTPGYVPHDRLGDALKAGATYSPAATQSQNDPKGFTQSLLNSSPAGMVRGLVGSFVQGPQNPQEAAIKGTTPDSGIVARTLGQIGLGGYRNLIAPSIASGKAAIQDAQSPNLSDRLASGSEALSAVPIVGQGINAGKSVLQQYLSGDKAGALGSAIGNVGTAGMTAALGGEALKPQTTGTLSPLERASVAVTKAVNPQGMAFRGYRQAIADQGVNVLDFAKQNGLPITDARDFGKAASLAAKETQDHYTNNVLGPHVNTPVDLSGVSTDLGDSATLGDVNQRVNNITQDLRAGQRKATPGQTASALSGDDIRGLQTEQGGLTDILHRSLGDLNQMHPLDISNLRQRAGQMRTIAGETEGASDALSGSSGKAEVGAGSGLPTSSKGAIDSILSKLQGGPETIASRNVLNALRTLRDVPDAPRSGLPAAYPQSTIAPSVADQINIAAQQRLTQQAYQHGADLDAAAQDAAQGRSGVADYLRGSNTDIQKQAANLEFLKSNNLEQAAQDAANQRSSTAFRMRTSSANQQLQSAMDAANKQRLVGSALRQMGYENAKKR